VVRIGIGEPTWGMAKLLSEGHGRGLQGTEGEGSLEFWDVLVMIFSIFFHLLIHAPIVFIHYFYDCSSMVANMREFIQCFILDSVPEYKTYFKEKIVMDLFFPISKTIIFFTVF
jgi:hypothetical protein